MANHYGAGEWAELVEAELRGLNCGCLVPDGGLDRWVNQDWSFDAEHDAEEEVHEWALSWIEQCADGEIEDVDNTLNRVRKLAYGTAEMFVEEFGEPLDPDKTDWDGEAWANDGRGLSGDQQEFFWPIYQDALISRTRRLAPRTWTADEITDLFCEAHAEADEETREATRSHTNPFGDRFESLVWFGTVKEAVEEGKIDLEDGQEEASEEDIKEWADTVVGTGCPIFVATYDGGFPAVFCERASELAVNEAVWNFYGSD